MARTNFNKKIKSKPAGKSPRKTSTRKAPINRYNTGKRRLDAARRKRAYNPRLTNKRKYFQEHTFACISRLDFQRLVHAIVSTLFPGTDVRFQESAVLALHEQAEAYLIKMFEVVNLNAMHADRITIKVEDLDLADVYYKAFNRGIGYKAPKDA